MNNNLSSRDIDNILSSYSRTLNFILIKTLIESSINQLSQKDIDLIGSVTAEVIERSRTAVLAIPENTPFKEFGAVKEVAFITNFDQRDLIAFEAFFNTWKSFHFSVSLIHLTDSKDTWNEIKLAGIKEYFHKQYPGLEIHYDVVMNDNLLKGLDQYIKDNHIDIITLTSYKRNIFARLFNPSIARKMIFHSDTPLLVINRADQIKQKMGIYDW